jgi:isoleucyl-tRNA synthetase
MADVDPVEVAGRVADGLTVTVRADGHPITLEPEEITVTKSYGDDWAAAEDAGVVVLMDKRLTEELKQEGSARDVVRFVQVARKEAGLELEDRIVLSLRTESGELKAAIGAGKDYIAAETLATEIIDVPLDGPAGTSEVKIAGQRLRIELRKA